jgi:hypothetical protein
VRLVDADKQLEWVDCMKPIHGIGLEPVVAVETVRDLINGAPTIDAIPVEWLEWRIEHAKREGFVEVVKMFQTVRDWWNDQRDIWRDEREQEAR